MQTTSPEHTAASPVSRSVGLLLACCSLSVLLCVLAAREVTAVAQYRQIFAPLGSKLPMVTTLFLAGRYLWWTLPAFAAVLTVFAALRTPPALQRRVAIGFGALLALSLVLVAADMAAMYAPVFSLGQHIRGG